MSQPRRPNVATCDHCGQPLPARDIIARRIVQDPPASTSELSALAGITESAVSRALVDIGAVMTTATIGGRRRRVYSSSADGASAMWASARAVVRDVLSIAVKPLSAAQVCRATGPDGPTLGYVTTILKDMLDAGLAERDPSYRYTLVRL